MVESVGESHGKVGLEEVIARASDSQFLSKATYT